MGVAERRERDREARRQAILRSAGRLFRERPYDDVRVEDIAAAADVGKGTVYLYFADKDAIVAALAAVVLADLHADGCASAEAVRSGGLPAVEGIRRVLGGWTGAYGDVPWLFRLLVLDRPRLLLAGPGGTGVAGGLLAPLEDMVAVGRLRGEVMGEADPQLISRALWALFVGGLLLERRGDVEPADIRREGMAALMALVRGFCVPESHPAPEPAAKSGPAGG